MCLLLLQLVTHLAKAVNHPNLSLHCLLLLLLDITLVLGLSVWVKKGGFPKRKQKNRMQILLSYNYVLQFFQLLSLDHNLLIFQLGFTTSGFTIWICRLLTYFEKIQHSKHKKTTKSAFKSTPQKLIESKSHTKAGYSNTSHTNKVLRNEYSAKNTKRQDEQ